MRKVIVFFAMVLSLGLSADIPYGTIFQSIIDGKLIIMGKSSVLTLAQEDPHLFARLFRELSTYPSIVVTQEPVDSALMNVLFPGAMQVLIDGQSSAKNAVQEFLSQQSAYAIVFTNGLLSDAEREELLNCPHGAAIIAVEDLVAAFTSEEGHGVNRQKITQLMKRKIRMLCTAAIIPIKEDERRAQYGRALQRVIEFGYHPYIVESCVSGPTYLDYYSKNTLYSLSNNAALNNKGVNEFVAMARAFEHWSFDDEDMIIKLTGRYYFMSDSFIRFVEDHEELDATAKFVTVPHGPMAGVDAVLTGCFAMKCGEFKKMLAYFDYDWLERDMVCVEHVVGPYLNELVKKGHKVVRQDFLNVEANMFGFIGSNDISYW